MKVVYSNAIIKDVRKIKSDELIGRIEAVVKQLIEAEDKTAPYNDDQVARILSERGVDISRRTVAKYRQQLDIPPARRRKVY